jgi:membrane fusion protein (multidrug efflux system)
VLDATIYRAELQQAQAQLALSQANNKRASELKDRGAGTVRAADEALASLRNDEASVQLAQARLEKTRIAAPFDGILGTRRVSIGAYLNPGEAVINLEQIDPLKVDFRIPEVYLKAVHLGQTLEIETDAFPGQVFIGEVYAIDPLVDVEGRSIFVRARVPNTNGPLRPGLFAEVTLVVERHEKAILVPERAIVPFGEDQFVFRVVDGKASMTKVVIGERQEGEVEITEGLSPNDVVISEGQMKLRDGAPVQVVGETLS